MIRTMFGEAWQPRDEFIAALDGWRLDYFAQRARIHLAVFDGDVARLFAEVERVKRGGEEVHVDAELDKLRAAYTRLQSMKAEAEMILKKAGS